LWQLLLKGLAEVHADIDVAALEAGLPQRWIAESAYRIEREIADGVRPKVGVNVHADESDGTPEAPELFELEPGSVERQVARTAARVAARDGAAVERALEEQRRATGAGENVMPALVEAARAGATVGEMSHVFREAFGEFREPDPW